MPRRPSAPTEVRKRVRAAAAAANGQAPAETESARVIPEAAVMPEVNAEEGPGRADPMTGEPWTELGYARRLVKVYGDRLRYVSAWKKWLVWDGRRWADDDTGQAARWMKSIARRITADALAIENDAKREVAYRGARKGEAQHAIAGALALAATEAAVVVTPADLDSDPCLLNCPNGTLDLRTGKLGRHDPADLITKITRAAWRPKAVGREWAAFLARVQPDPEMRTYLARLTGHALEGRVTEHLLPILWGAGQNGKSTYVEVVMAALGDYAAAADPELVTARSFDVHPTGTADLFGLRLAVLHETDRDRRLAEGTVKRLTGGDQIKARKMREDFWEFIPSHTFLMLTNHKPVVAGTDEGIWRRLRLVPWPVTIPEAEHDRELPGRIKARELDAVLAFLVRGYQDWSARGLADPPTVAEATAGYRADSDVLGRFIEERCLTSPDYTVRSGELYDVYRRWCEAESAEPVSIKALAADLEMHGFRKAPRSAAGVMWRGIALKEHDTS